METFIGLLLLISVIMEAVYRLLGYGVSVVRLLIGLWSVVQGLWPGRPRQATPLMVGPDVLEGLQRQGPRPRKYYPEDIWQTMIRFKKGTDGRPMMTRDIRRAIDPHVEKWTVVVGKVLNIDDGEGLL